MLKNLYKHRELIWNFAKRNLIGRYKGSYLGILWSFLDPLFMLCIYTFVFGIIFGVKLPADIGTSSFAIFLFSGLIPWRAFSESLNTSTGIIISNVNLVKKVIFPLEIFSTSTVISSIINSFFSMTILFIGMLILDHRIPLTFLYLFIIFIPQILFTTGLCWFLSSIGVFLRDIKSIVSVILMAWMYMTPIFYPVERIPEKFRLIMNLNPMHVIVTNYRRVLLMGVSPDWFWLTFVTITGIIFSILGYTWFMKSKGAFADVI